MLDLIRFELYKIFSKKSVRIVLLLTVLFSVFNAFGPNINVKSKGLDSMDDVYSVMKEHEGKVITPEGMTKAEEIIENLSQKEQKGEKLTKEEISMDDVYSVMKEHEGKVITPEGMTKAEEIIENLSQKEQKGEKLTKEEIVYRYYLYDAMIADPTYIVNNQYYTIDEMKDEISKLEKENKIDTYEYKNIKFVYDKVKNIEESK